MANEFPEATGRELNRFVTNEVCTKCGHEIRFSDREDGTCEVRIVLEQAELGVETTVCGCFCQPAGICAQCESNARWNEAGGYHQLAKECREYCQRGHKEQLHAALHPQPQETKS